jgi:DNA-binding NtrC family response regulator
VDPGGGPGDGPFERANAVEVILLSGQGSIETAVAAIKQGAFDFVPKPREAERLFQVVTRAAERKTLLRHTRALST